MNLLVALCPIDDGEMVYIKQLKLKKNYQFVKKQKTVAAITYQKLFLTLFEIIWNDWNWKKQLKLNLKKFIICQLKKFQQLAQIKEKIYRI